jgi:hypothetical protein
MAELNLPRGWVWIDTSDGGGLVAELHRDVSATHPLRDVALEALARRSDTNDVLVRRLDRPDSSVVEHPTCNSSRKQTANVPGIEMEGTAASFLVQEALWVRDEHESA